MRRGQFGSAGHHASFALSPFRVVLCALVCKAVQSPILSLQKQAQVFAYVIRQLRVSQLRFHISSFADFGKTTDLTFSVFS